MLFLISGITNERRVYDKYKPLGLASSIAKLFPGEENVCLHLYRAVLRIQRSA